MAWEKEEKKLYDKKRRGTKKYKKEYRERCNEIKETWKKWLLLNGYGIPSREWNYHHKNHKLKLFAIGTFILHRIPTEENITLLEKELKKCIYLPVSIHRNYHRGKMGRFCSPNTEC